MSFLAAWFLPTVAFATPIHDCTTHGRGHHEHGEGHLQDLGYLTGEPSLLGEMVPSEGALPDSVMEVLKKTCVVQGDPIYLEDVPADWYSADSHTHWESCGTIGGVSLFWDSFKLAQTYMSVQDVQISSPLLWNTHMTQKTGYLIDIPFTWVPDSTPFLYAVCTAPPTPDPDAVDEFPVGTAGPLTPIGWGTAAGVSGHRDKLDLLCTEDDASYPPWDTPRRTRYIRTGIEISGWNASRLGHATALNLSPEFADVYIAPPCAFNDGTGDWANLQLREFRQDEQAITGYAHHNWPIGTCAADLENPISNDVGFDWRAELGPGYCPDFKVWSCSRAHFPNQRGGPDAEYTVAPPGPVLPFRSTGMPMVAPMDAIVGLIDYLEAVRIDRVVSATVSDVPGDCDGPDHDVGTSMWHGMYYKLQSAGKRIGVTAGTDGTCTSGECASKTYAYLPGFDDPPVAEDLYDAYTQAIKAGEVTLAFESYHHLDAYFEEGTTKTRVGETVLDPSSSHSLEIRYRLAEELFDSLDPNFEGVDFTEEDRTVEVVVNGDVVWDTACNVVGSVDCPVETQFQPPQTNLGWREIQLSVPFSMLGITNSSWVAVRTKSQKAHTAAIYVVMGGRPIAKPLEAEYWMLYSDYVTHQVTTEQGCAPAVPFYGCSDGPILLHVAEAREVFKSYRDYGYETWEAPGSVARAGTKSSFNGDNPIGATIAVDYRLGQPKFRISCINAPPNADGYLILGKKATGVSGFLNPPFPLTCPLPETDLYIDPNLLGNEVTSDDVGQVHLYSDEIPIAGTSLVLDDVIFPGETLYAQFVWHMNQSPCGVSGASSSEGMAVDYDPPTPSGTNCFIVQ